MSARFSVNDVAERLDVEREAARGLVKLLVELDLAKQVGERRPESGRGKSEGVYNFVEGFEDSLAKTLKVAFAD